MATDVLAYIPCVTGTISLLCSSQLIYQIVRRRKKTLRRVKERLLLGLSIGDLFFSTACVISCFAGPQYYRQYYNHIPTFGNDATCNFQGFLYQVGITNPLYIVSLCGAFYLSTCHNKRDEDLLKRLEPATHIVIWLFAIVSATLGVLSNTVYFMGFNGCFIVIPQPRVCERRPDLADCYRDPVVHPRTVVFVLTIIPTAISVIGIIVFMSLIFRQVKIIESRSSRWDFRNSIVVSHQTSYQSGVVRHSGISTDAASINDTGPSCYSHNHSHSEDAGHAASTVVHATSDERWRDEESIGTVGSKDPPTKLMGSGDQCADGDVDDDDDGNDNSNNVDTKKNGQQVGVDKIDCDVVDGDLESVDSDDSNNSPRDYVLRAAKRTRATPGTLNNITTTIDPSTDRDLQTVDDDKANNSKTTDKSTSSGHGRHRWLSLLPTLKRQTSGDIENSGIHHRRNQLSNTVSETGILYVLGYFLTYLPAFWTLFTVYPSTFQMYLAGITMPLQGLWVWMVYMRSRIKAIRRNRNIQHNPATWREAFWEAVSGR